MQTTEVFKRSYGDFAIRYEPGVANISNYVKRGYIEVSKEIPVFNPYQWFLLQRCLKGLKVYQEEELRYISKAKQSRIKKVHLHSIDVLNEYCQRAIITITNKLIVKHFRCMNDYSVPRAFLDCNETDPTFTVRFSFKELGITPKMVAGTLVSKSCLPWNYFDLTLNDDPRMIKLKKPQQDIDAL